MASFKATVLGLKDLDAALTAMVKSISPPEAAEVMAVGAAEIRDSIRAEISARGLVDKGKLRESVEVYKVNQFAAGVRVGVVYGAVHEFGLPNQVITERQRSFFWFKYMSEGDEMWLALALSTTYSIPARPYFRPGVDKGKSAAAKAIASEVASRLQAQARG